MLEVWGESEGKKDRERSRVCNSYKFRNLWGLGFE